VSEDQLYDLKPRVMAPGVVYKKIRTADSVEYI
jgi:hypothetical protein